MTLPELLALGLAILCLALCVIGQVLAGSDAVDGWFSKEDRKELLEVLAAKQQKDGSYGSVEDTYEAVGALFALKYGAYVCSRV